jgi:hypothetical protein
MRQSKQVSSARMDGDDVGVVCRWTIGASDGVQLVWRQFVL